MITFSDSSKMKSSSFFVAIFACGISTLAIARDYFNPALLEGVESGGMTTDLTKFESGIQAPGDYFVDVFINNKTVDSRIIRFTENDRHDMLLPCISASLLKQWGVKTELYPALKTNEEGCVDLSIIPDAKAIFDFNSQRLTLSIPQIAMVNQVRGAVAPELWDNGITAVSLNYSLNGYSSKSRESGTVNSSQFANLRPGFNIGPWRLRNYSTWNRDSNGNENWTNVYTYVQRPIVALRSQMVLGDSSSYSDVFDSIPFRGAQLSSDEDMLPDSLRGYAPVVRGIARTNAQVVIRQNGYQIYQNTVAPGAFEIDDMYSTGGAGDLYVTVKEADGSEQHFIVPFASLPVLQREGRLKYSLTGGHYRSYNRQIEKTPFGQFTGAYGLPYGLTIYGGVQNANNYKSMAAGLGSNFGAFGAASVDLTQAYSELPDATKSAGQSWRARYSKNFVETGTNFAIAGYRYSTSGYYGMQEVLEQYGNNTQQTDRRRNRAEVTMNQSLGDKFGSVSLSAMREDYWKSGRTMQSSSIAYNNNWRAISYSLNYTKSKNGNVNQFSNGGYYEKNELFSLNISMPLNMMSGAWASYGLTSDKYSGTTQIAGLSGTALENDALNWGVQQGYSGNGVGYSGNLNGNYKGAYGLLNSGYDYDRHSQRLNYGIQGGVIAHQNGVTFSQPLGETNVLIKAPGVGGVGINNQTGASTDWRGYTAISSVQPYKNNTIGLKTDTFPDNAEFDLTTAKVTPTRGAIVRAEFTADIGSRAIVTLLQKSGKPVPFGAMVTTDSNTGKSFIVGDEGNVFLTGLKNRGEIVAYWGSNKKYTCNANYSLDAIEDTSINIKMLTCK
ncbi:fimbrial biogenesis outer membrane usher protein [Enterobacter bugandensis]|uniref:fimbria/pilus outer membrane usher protein n=1 Tax=Enterobacter bugandensis TaxID=881260 RepID=UPI0023B19A44|nr:fimbria/pilus outer membrane usher protein [Enterobacter bugandensis]MDE7590857.1 fimbrial biogenesis outer membrane usher protein [Enterobacter bugandensis]